MTTGGNRGSGDARAGGSRDWRNGTQPSVKWRRSAKWTRLSLETAALGEAAELPLSFEAAEGAASSTAVGCILISCR